ncbi:MAG TPA: hypothetical protein ENK43_07375, partial [Planctomycetes bacterium]|nr:hypothetical protein [Planctomycetota bacterium]
MTKHLEGPPHSSRWWVILLVLAVLALWAVLRDGDAATVFPGRVGETPSPGPRPRRLPQSDATPARDGVTTTETFDAPVAFSVVDRLSGRDVPWSDAQVSPPSGGELAGISIRPNEEGALVL